MNIIRLKNKLLNLRLFGSSIEYYLDYGIFVHLKFAIARHLDRNPKYCWPNLVTWALNWTKWWLPFRPNHNDYNLTHTFCDGECIYCEQKQPK